MSAGNADVASDDIGGSGADVAVQHIDVRVTMLSGVTFAIQNCSPTMKVVELKKKVSARSGIAWVQQELLVGTTSLQDDDSLFDAGVGSMVCVSLLLGTKVLFGIRDLAHLQKTRLDKGKLHEQARGVLNEKIRFFAGNPSDQVLHIHPVDTSNWPTWKEYIASHAAAAQIVGSTGIIAVRIEELEGTVDANRGGARRVDIVMYNADGKHYRLHPGSKRRNDAQLIERKTIIGAAEPDVDKEPPIEPAAYTYRKAPLVFTRDTADNIPQVDRIGRRKIFDLLQKLPASRPLELTQASTAVFPWWLWLPTIGAIRDDVIGIGIERIELLHTWTERTGYVSGARFLIVRTDKTAVLLNAFHGEGRRSPYYHQVLETNAGEYKWWVNRKPGSAKVLRDMPLSLLNFPAG